MDFNIWAIYISKTNNIPVLFKMEQKKLILLIILLLTAHHHIAQKDTLIPHIAEDIEYISILKEEQKFRDLTPDQLTYDFNKEDVLHLEALFIKLYSLWENKSIFENFMKYGDTHEKSFIQSCIKESNKPESAWSDLKRNEWLNLRGDLLFSQWDLFIKLLQLESNTATTQQISNNLSYIESHLTLQHLAFHYKNIVSAFPNTSKYIKERNQRLIRERLSILERENFVFYRSLYSKPDLLKSIGIYLDNDVFTFGGINQDREYTGGGKVTLTTDYLNTRWFNLGWLKYLNKKRYNPDQPQGILMKYQSLSIGAKAYTPYIRYKDYKMLADTIHNRDRPFASVIYLEKSTYRLWPKGLVRNRSLWRFGMLGSDEGNRIQAALHQDAITESQRVYGWDKQIANGGRIYIQTEQKIDFLLYSTNNEFSSVLFPNAKNSAQAQSRKIGFNLVQTNNLLWGGKITGFETGLRISTANFKQVSGAHHLKLFNPNHPIQFAVSLDAGIYYRYVHHNSLLEDFGYLKTIKDDKYDNEPISEYFFNREVFLSQTPDDSRTYDRPGREDDQLKRHLFKWDIGLNLRFRRSTLFFRMVYYTKEYKINKDFDYIDSFLDFYNADNTPESGTITDYQNQLITGFGKQHNDFLRRNFYAYGTLGVVWLFGDEQ